MHFEHFRNILNFPRYKKHGDSSHGGCEAILIIDDDDFDRVQMATELHLDGYEIHQAACGEEGYEKLKANPQIKLAIVDFCMFGIGGPACILDLREYKPDLKIICISGSFDLDQRIEISGLAEAIDDRVQKFADFNKTLKDLLQKIRKLLDEVKEPYMNKTVLVCKHFNQAVFFDACFGKKCRKEKDCIFSRILRKFGDLYSEIPRRYSSIAQVEEDIGHLNPRPESNPQPSPPLTPRQEEEKSVLPFRAPAKESPVFPENLYKAGIEKLLKGDS